MDEPNEDLGGGALCAPIAAQVVETCMQELNIEPEYDEKESKNLSVFTPNVIGKSVNDAKSALNSKNLKCKIVGNGKKVVRQSPASSSTIPTNGTVVLYTTDEEKQVVTVPDFSGLTISEANALASENNLNIEINGINLSASNVVAYRQSTEKGAKVSAGTVITVSFKNTNSVLD